MNISISRNGEVIGTWSEEEVRAFYQAGQLVPTDYYWKEGMAEWDLLENLINAPATFAVPPHTPLPPSPATVEKKKSPTAGLTILSTLSGIVGFVLANQFSDHSVYVFEGAVIGAVLGAIPYCIGRFYLKTTRLKASIAIGILAGALLGLALSPILLNRKFDAALQSASLEINKITPKMVDNITRLDTTSVGPDRRLIYRYTLIGNTVYDPAHVKEALTPLLIKGWQKNPSLKLYQKYGVTLEYDYSYENGKPITSAVFKATDVPEPE